MQSRYVLLDLGWKRTVEVIRGDGKQASIEEEVQDVKTKARDEEMRTICNDVASSKQQAKADTIETTTPKTATCPPVPPMNPPTPHTGINEVLKSS